MEENNIGSTTIAPNVLSTIARLTTLSTPGVSRLAPSSLTSPRTAAKPDEEGVKIAIKDDVIYIDIFVLINSEENVRLVAESVQHRVHRAISEMVGMEVARIDVHVTDVDIEA